MIFDLYDYVVGRKRFIKSRLIVLNLDVPVPTTSFP